jgi:hypothetical protein
MNKLIKKSIAMLICFTFIFLTVTSSTATDVQQKNVIYDNPDQELTTTSETITLYRHGPDGSITPIEVDISLEDGQDLEEAIDAKCREILEEDEEIQEQVKALQNLTFGAVVFVQSKGKGFHYQAKLIEKLVLRFWLWKLLIPRIALFMASPLVFCRYAKDPDAETYYETIAPSKLLNPYLGNLSELFWRQDKNVTIKGPHSVVINSFIGITWGGLWSIRRFNFFGRASLMGYGRFVLTNDKL